jgi:hypothetical protein
LRQLGQAGREHLAQVRVVALSQFLRFLVFLFVQEFLESLNQADRHHVFAPRG